MTFVALLLAPVSAFAQEAGKTGIVLATPGTFALLFQVSERIAVRPELGFSTSTNDNNSLTTPVTGSAWSLSPGVSGLYYTGKWEALRAYVAGRYAYAYAKTTATTAGGSIESTSKANTLAGSFGADYALHQRFSVFAELGLAFVHTSSSTPAVTISPTANVWAIRTAVGGIFYF